LFLREMLADWRGAGRATGSELSTREWYAKNYFNIKLHPTSRAWVNEQLDIATGGCVSSDPSAIADIVHGGDRVVPRSFAEQFEAISQADIAEFLAHPDRFLIDGPSINTAVFERMPEHD
jgi:hypothetical protein